MGDEQRSITSLKTTAKEWARKVGIDSIDRLNEMIDSGKGLELILVCEAMQSNCMYEIARKVSEQKRRIILISGPSSAGKTTLSHRLSIQLRAMGLRPHAIAADNYFVNREDNPKDENGNYDFECLEAMDLETLNRDMTRLLDGEEIELPVFNFKTGVREYHGDLLKIGENDVIIMEGEEKYIFPYESEADEMFNSGLLYEYTAIRREARPLLLGVDETSEHYQDAARLLRLIDMFHDIDTEYIPANSILREFIGGGCFRI